MKILGIRRASRFSPNSKDRDGRVFTLVARSLEARGHQVVSVDEDEALALPKECRVVFSMARGAEALAWLQRCEGDGVRVVNTPAGVRRCADAAFAPFLTERGIAVPQGVCVPLQKDEFFPSPPYPAFPLWVKRGEGHSRTEDDVCRAETEGELLCALRRMASRGLSLARVEEHVAGDLLKCYGVAGTPFFRFTYPTEEKGAFSKFGLERFNGIPHHYPFDAVRLASSLHAAAAAMGVPVYGCDLVVTKDRQPVVIDFNDWPSFAPFPDAAEHIATLVEKKTL